MEKMTKTENDAVSKFGEKLARRLGEIAILLHLARHPEGDHAYEIRSKASDILFMQKRKSIDFVNNLLEITDELHTFATEENIGTHEYEEKKEKLEELLEKCPIFKFNPHFIKILTKDTIHRISPTQTTHLGTTKDSLHIGWQGLPLIINCIEISQALLFFRTGMNTRKT